MRRILIAIAILSLSRSLPAAVPHYFTTTAAGLFPSAINPIALKQYLGSVNVAYDSHGNLYYATSSFVWRLNADGTDTLLAGSTTAKAGGDGGIATQAVFSEVFGIALDGQQNLYIFDTGFSLGANKGSIRKVTPDGRISTVVSGIGALGMTVDAAGNIYTLEFITQDSNSSLLKYSPSGARSVIANLPNREDNVVVVGSLAFVANVLGIVQVDLSSGVITTLIGSPYAPVALAAGPDGYVYFIDSFSQVRKIKPAGNGAVIVVAGSGQTGLSSGDGGPATLATFNAISLAVNPVTNDVAVFDDFAGALRIVSAATGKIQTVAGAPHSAGDNGPAVLAQFQFPAFSRGLACDPAGNVYFWDDPGTRIRKVSVSGIVTTVAGTGLPGNSGDGGKAVQASVTPGGGMAADKSGNLYFVNGGVTSGITVTVRKINTNGTISTVAGGGSAPFADGGKALSTDFTKASSVLLTADAASNFYMAFQGADGYSRIVKIDPSGTMTLIAGGQLFHPDPDSTPAKTAVLGGVSALAVDSAGVVYFGETFPGLLRTVDSQGLLQTIAGNGSNVFNGSQISAGPALSVQIGAPLDLAIDGSGNFIFSPGTFVPQIVVVDKSGNLTPIAGRALPQNAMASTGDGGDALNATFASIGGLAVDPSGDIYVTDNNYYIRKLAPYDPAHPPPFVASGGIVGSGGSVPALAAVAPDGDASVYGANFIAAGTHRDLSAADLVNGKVPTMLAGVCVDFAGVPAAVLNVYPGQINVQVPANVPPGPVTVQVILNCGTPNAVQSNFGGVAMQTASPEFFSFLPDLVTGANPIAAINATTFIRIGPPNLIPGVSFVPAKPGDIVEAYGTGWGLTSPALDVGVIPGAAAPLMSLFKVTFAGTALPPSSIYYAGASPCCAGLYQVDFAIPANTPNGNQPLVIQVAGVPSPPAAYIAVQQ